MRRIAVLMGGGKGTRFWPMSVEKSPKQFLKITSSRTMLQESAERMIPLLGEENIWVVTVRGMEKEVKRQLPFVEGRVIVEPVGRNTAAAIILSMRRLVEEYGDFLVSFLPADHHIKDKWEFQREIDAAYTAATADIVTFGIPPKRPETGYGYIKFKREEEVRFKGVDFYQAEGFVEKPNRERAEKMLQEGNYLWNSGIFIWYAKIFLQRLAKFSPLFYNYYKELEKGKEEEVYMGMEALPIDEAFMEKLPRFFVAEANFRWSDLGSWHSLWEVMDKDDAGNATRGEAYFVDSEGNLVVTDKKTIVIGAKDLAIVDTENGLLVMKRDSSALLKKILKEMEEKNDKMG